MSSSNKSRIEDGGLHSSPRMNKHHGTDGHFAVSYRTVKYTFLVFPFQLKEALNKTTINIKRMEGFGLMLLA